MYDSGCFGDSDGALTEIDDLMEQFVTFQEKYLFSGTSNINDETRRRVIVGAKGAGKTVYLRRLKAQMGNNESVFVTSIDRDAPTTSSIIEFSQNFSEKELTEQWMYLWKFAILRSVVSQLLCENKWNYELTESKKDLLKSYSPKLFPEYKFPKSIYAEARAVLSKYHTRKDFIRYSEQEGWDDLEYIIGEMIREMPPIYFFIDSIDEEYRHAPMYWHRCQKGLFYRVMRLARKEIYGNRLHVIIAIRDNVLSSVSESEHQTRYINDKRLKLLNWDYQTAEYFLDQKIRRLPKEYFCDPNDVSLEGWLGIRTIDNNGRHMQEDIRQYILRHTRLLPRDIVMVGNALTEISNKRLNGQACDLQEEIKNLVSESAKIFGNELLEICSNQINNNAMPLWAAHNNFDELYTSAMEYMATTAQVLKKHIYTLHNDRFSWEKLLELEKAVDNELGFKSKMCDILWQNGGIGYYDYSTGKRREIFFNSKYPVFLLPKNREIYLLRSCLIDAVGISCDHWDKDPVMGGIV